MQGHRNILILALVAFALPLFGQRIPGHIEIVVDLNAHRAYVPYGTVLPSGIQVRVARRVPKRFSKFVTDAAMDTSLAPNGGEHVFLLSQPPLVFEYASESRFAESRKHVRSAISTIASVGHFPIKPLSRSCQVTT